MVRGWRESPLPLPLLEQLCFVGEGEGQLTGANKECN